MKGYYIPVGTPMHLYTTQNIGDGRTTITESAFSPFISTKDVVYDDLDYGYYTLNNDSYTFRLPKDPTYNFTHITVVRQHVQQVEIEEA